MSLEFDYYSLGDLVKIKYGKNQKKVQDDDNGKYPIYGTGGLMGYSIEYLYDKPSVLIGRKGSIEKVRYIDEPFWTVDTLFYTEVNEEIVIPKFLYYIMSQINLGKYNEGTSIPSLRTETLNRLDLPIPDLDYQNRVLSILSSIDKKIEINEKINKNLAELAKTIFRDRFIFYKGYESQMIKTDVGEIPNTFEVKSVDEISKDVVCGKTPSTKVEENYGDKMPFITIPDMHGNVFVIDTERKLSEIGIKSQIKKILPENSICVSCIATAGLVSLTSEESQTNQQINSVICKEGISPYFVYLYMEELSEYIKMLGSGGSTTLNLNKREFGKIELVIPPQGDMIEFHEQISPIFEEIKTNQYEIEKLTKLRDTLLPKLMSGEIDVSKINCDFENIAHFMIFSFKKIIGYLGLYFIRFL